MLRYKIRTLLFLTLLCGLAVAIFARPYVDASAERQAILRLEKDWDILLDSEAKLGAWQNKKIPAKEEASWVEMPARYFFGEKKLRRIKKLRIVSPLTPNPSLEPLSAINQITHLKFNRMDFELTNENCKPIARLHELKILEFGCTVKSGFELLQRLPLTRLICYGRDWDQKQFEAIGNIDSLEMTQLINESSGFTTDNLAALSNLQELKHLCLMAKKDHSIDGIQELEAMSNLESVSLFGDLDEENCKALAANPNLKSAEFIGGKIYEQVFENLASSQGVRSASFGHMQISVQTYDALVEAGIEVEHYGLTGDELSENYFLYNEIYFPVNHEKSELTAYIKPDSDKVDWSISVAGAPKPRHESNFTPNLELYSFSFAGRWQELVGHQVRQPVEDWDDASGNFYDGIHVRANDHTIEFPSREGNQFHLVWECSVGDGPQEAIPCKVDTLINFKRVFVQNHNKKTSVEAAKQAVGLFFDLQDFEEPKLIGRNKRLFEFTLKPQK